jgi:ABC-type transport system involved in multi-copper enzyme maturation permease subunit
VSAGLDPIVLKELAGASRRWTLYALRIVYAAVIALILWSFWEMVGRRMAYRPSLSDYAELGRELFSVFAACQMLFAALAGTAAASDLVTREVRAGTLGLLSLTPLSSWRIAFGKWKAAMVEGSTLILCGLPLLAMCYYLGGVGLWEVAWGTSLALASAALAAATALLFSSLFRAGYVALIAALLALAAYTFLAAWAAFEWNLEALVAYLHPAIAATGAIETGRGREEYGWIGASAFSLVCSGLLLLGAAARIGRLAAWAPRPSLLARAMEAMDRFYEGINPSGLRLFAAKEGVWESDALLWKELRTRAAGKLRYATRIGLGLLLLLVPFVLALPDDDWQAPAVWGSGLLLLLMAMAVGVGLFVREKEERKWDVLLSTPLSAWEILRAKLLAGLAALAPLWVISSLYFVLVAWAYRLGLLGWMVTTGAIGLAVLFAYAVGAWASLRSRRMRSAFSITLAVMAGILLILPIVIELLNDLPRVHWSRDEFPRCLIRLTSPETFLDPLSRLGWTWDLRDRYADLMPWFVGYVSIYGLGIALLVWRMLAKFNRITGRS